MKPFALTTGKMAKLLGIDRKFLTDNKDVIFKKGIHYTIPPGKKHPLWIVEKMEEWLFSTQEISPKGQEVLQHIIS